MNYLFTKLFVKDEAVPAYGRGRFILSMHRLKKENDYSKMKQM